MFRFYSLLLIFLSIVEAAKGQGLIFDSLEYQSTPLKAELMDRDYSGLPKSVSLKAYCPSANNQGDYGTCVGWATAWAARTMIEAIQNQWRGQEYITKNSFAPGFCFLPSEQDTDPCKSGTIMTKALNLLRETGVPKYSDFSEVCPKNVTEDVLKKAQKNKIKDYTKLFAHDAPGFQKIQSIKKTLSQNLPVLVALRTPPSFKEAGACWLPDEVYSENYTGHAVCVVGYDDAKWGGAFEIQNSWGESWGEKGFTYVRYKDAVDWFLGAYEITPYPKVLNPSDINMEGSLSFILADGREPLSARKLPNSNFLHYKLDKTMYSGSRYRMHLANKGQAYVYVFATDEYNNVSLLFPSSGTSAILPYTENNVALPSERHWIQLDNTVGTDFVYVLYCKESIDFTQVKRELMKPSSNPRERLNAFLQDKLISPHSIIAESHQASFKAASGQQSILLMLIEMTHR